MLYTQNPFCATANSNDRENRSESWTDMGVLDIA